MDWFGSFVVFDRVATTLSFTEAGRQLKLTQGAVSRQIRALEDELGARLINRTTRKLSLTEVGTALHQRCVRILEDVDEARRIAMDLQTEPQGQLRISAPISFGQRYLATAIAQYLARYPKISIDVTLTDRYVDLIEEGFDVAVRVGKLPDSSLGTRAIAPLRFVLCASPGYLARYGAPRKPADLTDHQCLLFTYHGPNWRFEGPDGVENVQVRARLWSNNADLLLAAALAGEGLFYAPTFHLAEALRSGALVSVLSEYKLLETRIQAVFPHASYLSVKVRSLVDFLAKHFGPEPEWDRGLPTGS